MKIGGSHIGTYSRYRGTVVASQVMDVLPNDQHLKNNRVGSKRSQRPGRGANHGVVFMSQPAWLAFPSPPPSRVRRHQTTTQLPCPRWMMMSLLASILFCSPRTLQDNLQYYLRCPFSDLVLRCPSHLALVYLSAALHVHGL